MECNVINLSYAKLFCVEQNINKCIELTFRDTIDVPRAPNRSEATS